MPSKIHLLLAPGLLCTKALWSHQIERLSDVADIYLVDTTKDNSLSAMANRALSEAPDQFAFAGLSMGGYLAFEIMRQAPERLTRLALLDTTANADSAEQTIFRKKMIQLARAGKFVEAVRHHIPLFLHPDKSTQKSWQDSILKMAETIGPLVYEQQLTAIMNRRDSQGILSTFKVPTTLICGRQDSLTPVKIHEDMASSIPKSTLHIVEECGHLSTLEQPSVVTELLRNWLT
jgi:pimeloyl-ACP methyl ester carboxylesterase